MSSAPRIDDLGDWLRAFAHPSTLTELAALLVCVALAWAFVWLVRRASGNRDATSIWFGRRIFDGVMFPVVLLCLAYGARALAANWTPLVVFRIALPDWSGELARFERVTGGQIGSYGELMRAVARRRMGSLRGIYGCWPWARCAT